MWPLSPYGHKTDLDSSSTPFSSDAALSDLSISVKRAINASVVIEHLSFLRQRRPPSFGTIAVHRYGSLRCQWRVVGERIECIDFVRGLFAALPSKEALVAGISGTVFVAVPSTCVFSNCAAATPSLRKELARPMTAAERCFGSSELLID